MFVVVVNAKLNICKAEYYEHCHVHVYHSAMVHNNKDQSNLAKGDITLLSYSPDGSTCREDASVRCIWDPGFGGSVHHRGSAMVPFEGAMGWFPINSLL